MARPYHAPEFLHPTNWTIKESLRFLQERDPTKPFFLKTSFAGPHSPYSPPLYYLDLYLQKRLPEPAVGEWAWVHNVPEDAASPTAWRGVRSAEEVMRARAGYYGSVSHIDHQIGRLLMFMQSKGLLEHTLIIFTSDHGDMLGDHNLWRKTYAYEGSAHIPPIIKLPSSFETEVRSIDRPVCLQDIMPTVLDTVGLPISRTVDGRSLLGLMRGDDVAWREYLHGEHSTCYSEEQEMQYLTDGKMKYIWFPRINQEQLFNLIEDPYERHNLAEAADGSSTLKFWTSRLISVLAPRRSGLTDGECLVGQAGKPFLISPKYKKRMGGTLDSQ